MREHCLLLRSVAEVVPLDGTADIATVHINATAALPLNLEKHFRSLQQPRRCDEHLIRLDETHGRFSIFVPLYAYAAHCDVAHVVKNNRGTQIWRLRLKPNIAEG